jgi:Ni,Fe-hydrogenase III small subunit
MIKTFKNWKKQGKQFIPDITKPVLPESFKVGLPVISEISVSQELIDLAVEVCPTEALQAYPKLSLDMGKCVFCGECEKILGKEKLKFTNQYKNATNIRERLIVREGDVQGIHLDESIVRTEIRKIFGRSLKLRQVSAGGDNSNEMELNACGNVNFDMARFGIEFTASPRHSDGVVVTGPISANMAEALQICYDAVPNPKILVLCGSDAISGGIFARSPALDRSFLDKYTVDLYVPGNPIHPLTFINGILELIKYKF